MTSHRIALQAGKRPSVTTSPSLREASTLLHTLERAARGATDAVAWPVCHIGLGHASSPTPGRVSVSVDAPGHRGPDSPLPTGRPGPNSTPSMRAVRSAKPYTTAASASVLRSRVSKRASMGIVAWLSTESEGPMTSHRIALQARKRSPRRGPSPARGERPPLGSLPAAGRARGHRRTRDDGRTAGRFASDRLPLRIALSIFACRRTPSKQWAYPPQTVQP